MKKTIFIEGVCIAFILLFVYAAVSKLADYQKFRVQLGQSPLLTLYAGTVAWAVPCIEIIISLMLAVPQLKLAGLYAAFTLMNLFTAYIIAISRFSEYVPCSCGGILQGLSWDQHLVLNLCFILLAGAAVLWPAPAQKDIYCNKTGEAENLGKSRHSFF